MKTILVPCDFSESAVNAFRFAIDIASKSGGEITLLHVIESPGTKRVPVLSAAEEVYAKDIGQKLDQLILKWAKDVLVISSQVLHGVVATTIIEFAKEKNVDLIAMGTKGSAIGIKEILVGSTTEKVVASSHVPVIAIKEYTANPIRRIVLANSLIEENEALVEKVKAMQDLFGATLHIVYVNTAAQFLPDHETQKRLDDFAKRYSFTNSTMTIHNDFDPESGLINFAKEIKADMVAMGTHSRKGLAHILNSSVTKAVKYHLTCPIWTFKI